MAKTRKPIPKTQAELSQNTITPYDSRGKAPIETAQQSRANRRSVADSDVKQLNVGLKDIDTAIEYYFVNVIKPSVRQNGTQLTVPIIYGSQERWTAVQKDGYYRDKNGKIQTPLIMYKRDSVEKNRSLGNKMTANSPLHYGVFEKRYSKKNVYDRFSALQNRVPVREFYGVIMPDYVNIAYSCIIFTEYIEQMNKIVEAINFASDSYWGNREQFQFRAMIDTYTPTVELVQGQDRIVKTTFTINLLGYIIPDGINTSIANPNRFFSKAAVNFKLETAGTLEQLTARARTPERQSTSRFFESPSINLSQTTIIEEGMSDEEIDYVGLQTAAVATTVSDFTATFVTRQIVQGPEGFETTQNSFQVYVNGVLIQPQSRVVSQIGDDIVVDFLDLGYVLTDRDKVILIGKYR
jgi:hypothetical protein